MTQLHHLILCACGHEQYFTVAAQYAVHHADKDDDAPVVIVLAVKDKSLEGSIGIALGLGHIGHDIFKHRLNIDAVFGAYLRCVLCGQADYLLNFVFDALGVGSRQVNLIDDRQYLQIAVQRKIGVGQGLGLNALRGVHYQHRALTGGKRTADLVVEVHMARSVDKVEGIVLPVVGGVIQTHGAGLDGNAALLFKIHIVKDLILHYALLHRAAGLNKPVGKGGFAVVDMGDYGKISDKLLI